MKKRINLILMILSLILTFNSNLFGNGSDNLCVHPKTEYSYDYKETSELLVDDIEVATSQYNQIQDIVDIMKELSTRDKKNLEIYNQLNSKLSDAKKDYDNVLKYAGKAKTTTVVNDQYDVDIAKNPIKNTLHSIDKASLSLEKASLKSLEILFIEIIKIYCSGNFTDGLPQICQVATKNMPSTINNMQNQVVDTINNTINNLPITTTCVPGYDSNTHQVITCP